jgi:hypothetical protein
MPTKTTIDYGYDFDAEDRKKNEMVQRILEDKLRGASRFLVQKLNMGDAPSYIAAVTFRWIAQNLLLFTQLNLFKKHIDPKTGKFRVDEESVQDLQQRAPNWLRQVMMTIYLFRQPRRKFPPLLVVVQEKWVDDMKSNAWDSNGKATRTSMQLEPLTPDGSISILDLSKGATCFVLDGSHRYIGIKGIEELMIKGELLEKKADGSPGSKRRKKDDLMKLYHVDDVDVADILDETMGIEFIPAVLQGETREEARIRVRSVFVHVNKTAQPPTKGEIAILDEDNGFAIVAKRLAFNHSIFRKDSPGDRINWKTNALPSGSNWLTSSTTIITMVTDYLTPTGTYGSWLPESSKEIPFRPIEQDITSAANAMETVLDKIADLPTFRAIASGTKIDNLREFPTVGAGHLLLRPIGQQILGATLGYLHNHPDGPQDTLATLFKRLNTYDAANGFSGVSSPASPWYGITYDPFRGTMATDKKDQAVLLLRHLLHDNLTKDDKMTLLIALRSARRQVAGGQDRVFDWDGVTLVSPERLQLPRQI